MATRSTIALEYADGTVHQVYCHWDGYLSHNGAILLEAYSDPFKLQKLMDLGDLSCLGPNIGDEHSFDASIPDTCTFYGRDRGEENVQARKFTDMSDYRANMQHEEFDYILMRDGNWYVCTNGVTFKKLTAEMCK